MPLFILVVKIMYYHFNENVFFVKGAKNACIYDITGNMLFKVLPKVSALLDRLNCDEQSFSSFERQFLDSLVTQGILTKKNIPEQKRTSIEDIYNYHRQMNFAWIELTNLCNLRCVHCYNEKCELEKCTLSLDDFKHTVDEIVGYGIKKIQLIGGEPFVISKNILFQMMDYLSPKVESFEIFTNGTLILESDLIKIKSRYNNIHIATSLHSYIENEHEKVTSVRGSYKKTVTNLRNMKKMGIPYRFVGTLISGIKIGDELDFGMPSRRDYIRLSGRAGLELYDDKLLSERLITEQSFRFKNLGERIKRIYEESCFATHIYVGSDMNVYPCPMERRVSHGNLRNQCLADILDTDILNHSKVEVEGCKDCEYRFVCRDCRPDSLTGIYNAKPWYCTYDPYNGMWMNIESFKRNLLKTDECASPDFC